MDRAVRAPAAAWRDGGKLNHDKLAATISETVAKALGAKAEASKWDDTTGTLTMSMKRPSQLVPGLNLIDNIEVTALVGPEKLGTSDKLIIWLSGPSMDTVDEAQGARLKFSGSSTATSEAEGPPIDNGATVVALAKELNGQRWDPEKGAWK
jgi:hypothetical protein